MSYKIKLSKQPITDNKEDTVVGKIKQGEHEGKFINIVKDYIDEDGLNISLTNDWLDWIDEHYEIPINKKEIKEISYAIAKDEVPTNRKLKEIYDMFKESSNKENKVSIKGNEIEIIPCLEPQQVDNLYVCGRSGSGKSTFIGRYVEKFLNLFGKDSPVYLFSSKPVNDEPAYQSFIDNIQQIFLSKDELEQYVNSDDGTSPYEHFVNRKGKSIVIFDDTENLEKKVENLVKVIQGNILKTGRSSGIFTVNCRHILNSGQKTKDLFVECNKLILFPMGIPRIHTDYMLSKYFGFTKAAINELLNTKSRWIAISSRVPLYVLDEYRCYLPSL
jgi:hypothetical protein